MWNAIYKWFIESFEETEKAALWTDAWINGDPYDLL